MRRVILKWCISEDQREGAGLTEDGEYCLQWNSGDIRLTYPINAKARNSSTSKGKSSLKFVLKRAVTVSAKRTQFV